MHVCVCWGYVWVNRLLFRILMSFSNIGTYDKYAFKLQYELNFTFIRIPDTFEKEWKSLLMWAFDISNNDSYSVFHK